MIDVGGVWATYCGLSRCSMGVVAMSVNFFSTGTGTQDNLEQIVHLVDSGKLKSGL